MACNDNKAFFTNKLYKSYTHWSCSDICDFVRFGENVYKQIIGIPMGTNCAPLIADLFLFCYERDFMKTLQTNNKFDIIDIFNNTSCYLDDILNINNPLFDSFIADIYPKELKLNKSNNNDNETAFLDLYLQIKNKHISTKIYDKRDDFNFEIINYPQLDGDVPQLPSYGVYISQLVRFSRACSFVEDFHQRNRDITSKLLNQGFRYHKLRRSFCKFYHRNTEILRKYNTSLITFLKEGISHPVFYGDFVYKLRRIRQSTNFDALFKRLYKQFLHKKYDPFVLRRTVCLVLGPYTANNNNCVLRCTVTDKAVRT